MATRFAFVDDSGETRLAGFIVPEPGGGGLPFTGWTEDDSDPANVDANGGEFRSTDGDGNHAELHPSGVNLSDGDGDEGYSMELGSGFTATPPADIPAFRVSDAIGGTVAFDGGGLPAKNLAEGTDPSDAATVSQLGGSTPLRWLTLIINTNQAISGWSVGPNYYFPVIGDPVIGPVIPGSPTKVAADSDIASIEFRAPDDGGDPIVLNYVELAVANAAFSEVISVYSEADITIDAGQTYIVSADDLSGAGTVIGSDLSLVDNGGEGAIHSAAGGVFFPQISFDLTPPA